MKSNFKSITFAIIVAYSLIYFSNNSLLTTMLLWLNGVWVGGWVVVFWWLKPED
jgi:hypothetical protein